VRLCSKIDLTEQAIAQFDKFKTQIVFFGLSVLAIPWGNSPRTSMITETLSTDWTRFFGLVFLVTVVKSIKSSTLFRIVKRRFALCYFLLLFYWTVVKLFPEKF